MDTSYDKVSSIIMYLGINLVLKLNVILNKTNQYGDVVNYHGEYEYSHPIYNRLAVSVKLNFQYYLSLENVYEDTHLNKGFIKIGYPELYDFEHLIMESLKFFLDEKYKDLYFVYKERLFMNTELFKESELSTCGNIGDVVCKISPRIYEFNSNQYKGLDFFFDKYHGIINSDNLFGLARFISTFDLYTAAQGLLNYLANPMVGVNKVKINNVAPTVIKSGSYNPGSHHIGRKIGKHSDLDEL